MSGSRWLGWLNRPRPSSVVEDPIAARLRALGVADSVLSKAAQQRVLLGTRLASTVVAQGEISEDIAVDALSREAGIPGLCLQRSVLDVRCGELPEALQGRYLLAVGRHPDGYAVVACADPPFEAEHQQLELTLGQEVRPYVALHFYLARAIVAMRELRRDRQDAAFLLGEAVDAERLPGPEERLARVMPAVPAVAYTQRAEQHAKQGPRAVVAMTASPVRARLARWLIDQGMDVAMTDDGPRALQLIADRWPALVVVTARLAERSGIDIVRLLAHGTRYRSSTKIVLVPPDIDLGADDRTEGENVVLGVEEEWEGVLESLVPSLVHPEQPADDSAGQQARAALHRGKAQREEHDQEAATASFTAAVALDPFLAEAQLALARHEAAIGSLRAAGQRFRLADDLGVVDAWDLTDWAQILQGQGDLRGAARLWRRAAEIWPNAKEAERLQRHAAILMGAENRMSI